MKYVVLVINSGKNRLRNSQIFIYGIISIGYNRVDREVKLKWSLTKQTTCADLNDLAMAFLEEPAIHFFKILTYCKIIERGLGGGVVEYLI